MSAKYCIFGFQNLHLLIFLALLCYDVCVSFAALLFYQ
jgi:hypothetical protein